VKSAKRMKKVIRKLKNEKRNDILYKTGTILLTVGAPTGRNSDWQYGTYEQTYQGVMALVFAEAGNLAYRAMYEYVRLVGVKFKFTPVMQPSHPAEHRGWSCMAIDERPNATFAATNTLDAYLTSHKFCKVRYFPKVNSMKFGGIAKVCQRNDIMPWQSTSTTANSLYLQVNADHKLPVMRMLFEAATPFGQSRLTHVGHLSITYTIAFRTMKKYD